VAEQPNYPEITAPPESAGAAPENPLIFIHRLLRGRYRWAVGLGAVLALCGAVAGYTLIQPTYASKAIVQVAPATSKVLYTTEDSSLPPMFESFVKAQAQFVTTRRVLDLALQDEKLIKAGWPAGVEGQRTLQRAVGTSIQRGSQLINVVSSSPDAALAQESLNAVLRAYKRLYIDERGRTRMDRQRILEEQRATLQAELRGVHDQINDLAEEFGVDNLKRLHAMAVDELATLDSKIREVDLAIAEAQTRAALRHPGDATAGADGAPATLPDPVREREALEAALARQDPALGDLLRQEQALAGQLASLRQSGYGPNHRDVVRLRDRITALRVRIDDRVASGAGDLEPGAPVGDITAAPVEDLQALRARYQRLRNDAEEQATFLATRRRVIAGLEEEASNKQRLLDDARNALDQLKVEMRGQEEQTGRVNIASWGDRPITPTSDKRIPAAVAGFIGAGGVGVALIALLGLVNPRCRYVDDLERPANQIPLLGTLPNLDTGDPQQDELAALSVHQVRNVLELQHESPDGRGRVFTITSACAGEGKTSLTMALGMSFAAAGERTLIIDADLVGRGVTKQVRLDGEPGLREALFGEPVEACAHATPVANLMAMPTGVTEGFEPKNMSRERAQRLLTHLCDSFGVILVDTGPLMGSLEGNLLCALSDASVLVVTRGQSSRLVQASLARLTNIGGCCAGTVFNRARADDYMRSVSHASFHVASVRSSRQPITTDDSIIGSRALVQAVAGVHGDSAGGSGAA